MIALIQNEWPGIETRVVQFQEGETLMFSGKKEMILGHPCWLLKVHIKDTSASVKGIIVRRVSLKKRFTKYVNSVSKLSAFTQEPTKCEIKWWSRVFSPRQDK